MYRTFQAKLITKYELKNHINDQIIVNKYKKSFVL